MSELPLHVRVAEALGCTPKPYLTCTHEMTPDEQWYVCGCEPTPGGQYPHRVGCIRNRWLPRYDSDWQATGPLIERYGIELWKHDALPVVWAASLDGYKGGPVGYGSKQLIAACNLILALREAGKLDSE